MAKKGKNAKYLPLGVTKIKVGAKAAWVAHEDVNGWSLGLDVNGTYDKKVRWLKGLRFSTRKEVERILEDTSIVFVHLKDSTTVPVKDKGRALTAAG